MKHLRAKHSSAVVKTEDSDLSDAETDGEEKSDQLDKRRVLKSKIWEYFEVKDKDNKLATCSLCSQQFSYKTTSTNLVRHLSRKHSIDFGKVVDGSEDEEKVDIDEKSDDDVKVEILNIVQGQSKSSTAWQYFQVSDPEQKTASCNMCGALCSYRTSVSNLTKHARRKHGVRDQDEVYTDADDDQQPARAQRSIVWLYFKCVDRKARVARCQLCSKLLSHSSTLTNLKKHLARKHPNVNISRKKVLLSSGGELYEVEAGQGSDDDQDGKEQIQNETMQMDTVYLEDFDALEQEPPSKKLKRKHKKPELVSRIAYDTSSEEEVTFMNKYAKKNSDSLDHFGKYLASLLRQLPNHISNQLQTDFVKQVMSAQLTYDAQKSAVTDTETKPYTVTDTETKPYTVTDTQSHSNAYTATDAPSNACTVTDAQSNAYPVTDAQSNAYSITVTADPEEATQSQVFEENVELNK